MCWITDKKEYAEELTAQEDIKVIKFLGIMPNSTILMSPYRLYGYKVNMPMLSVMLMPEIDEYGNIRISKGYHSYAYPEKIVYDMTKYGITKACYGLIFESSHYSIELPIYPFTSLSYSPYECVIPKGAQYYINDKHEIVSETIIVKEPYNRVKLFVNGIMKSLSTFKKY